MGPGRAAQAQAMAGHGWWQVHLESSATVATCGWPFVPGPREPHLSGCGQTLNDAREARGMTRVGCFRNTPFWWDGGFASHCYNKLSSTLWTKATGIYSLSSGSQKFHIRCGKGHAPSQALEEDPPLSSSSSWWCLTFLGLWPHNSNPCLHLPMASFPYISESSLLFEEYQSLHLESTLNLGWFFSQDPCLITSANTLFPNKVTSWSSRRMDMNLRGPLFSWLQMGGGWKRFRGWDLAGPGRTLQRNLQGEKEHASVGYWGRFQEMCVQEE